MGETTERIFALLRLGVGTADIGDSSKWLLPMSIQEWRELIGLAERQGVAAIAFDGTQKLYDEYQKDITAARETPAEWMQFVFECTGMMTQYEQRSRQQRKIIGKLSEIWSGEGIKMMVFKGQANAAFYPMPEHRATGDIDCWLFGQAEKGDELLSVKGASIDSRWYRHSKITYKGETIENHRVMSHTRDGKRRQVMEVELRNMASQCLKEEGRCQKEMGGVYFPSAQFNACFLTYHALHHFISEGLRLKQITDWAVFLNEGKDKVDWQAFNDFCKRYKLDRFAAVMSHIAITLLGVKVNHADILTDDTYSEKILHSTLYEDEYLFNSGKSDWIVRWLLVKNMLTRDKWKYQDIAQRNVYMKLLQSIKGFILRAEIDDDEE